MTLATLAIVMKVMIPPGFMAPTASSNTPPFALVLCTGQGAVTIHRGKTLPGHSDEDKVPAKSGHAAPCAFAGQGAGAAPPADIRVSQAQFIAYRPHVPSTPPSLAPGRGLAGPPLPARGPPSLLI